MPERIHNSDGAESAGFSQGSKDISSPLKQTAYLHSAVASMLGSGIDSLLQSTAAFPVGPLDTVSKMANALQSAKTSALQCKILLFFEEAENISDYIREERAGWAEKLNKEGLGRQVILMLERADDERKAPLYAQLYCALMRQELTRDQFSRLCACAERAYFDDLKYLQDFDKPVIACGPIQPIAESLQITNFLSNAGSDSGGYDAMDQLDEGILYSLNSLGRLFLRLTDVNGIDWPS